MKGWRILLVGNHVHALDAYGAMRCAQVVEVPKDWRDGSGSDATTERGDFPKAWLRLRTTDNVVPWPCADIYWPNHRPSEECPYA